MKPTRAHRHPCALSAQGCRHWVFCRGEIERNHDGYPATICLAYHLPSGAVQAAACPQCAASRCADCGAITRLEAHNVGCASREAHMDMLDRR